MKSPMKCLMAANNLIISLHKEGERPSKGEPRSVTSSFVVKNGHQLINTAYFSFKRKKKQIAQPTPLAETPSPKRPGQLCEPQVRLPTTHCPPALTQHNSKCPSSPHHHIPVHTSGSNLEPYQREARPES